ncbi:MAG: TerD family protein [Candidatus Competibacteraceae bacterium]|nr:TerD family protein [Candidatus Competibacteraceae bacterium]
MSAEMAPGQNLSLTRQSPASRELEVRITWNAPGGYDIDTSAFVLAAGGKVRGDEDFIFYNQPVLPGGGIERDGSGRSYRVRLDKLPAGVERISFTLTLDQGQARRQAFSGVSGVALEVRDTANGQTIARFAPDTGQMQETALILAELYRRNDEWKVRALGQGFVGGLQPLAEQYGVEVAGEPSPQPQPPTQPPPQRVPPPSKSAPPPQPAVSLKKITLEKGKPVSLEKKGAQGFGEIVVNLNWSRKPVQPSGGGLLGGLFGGGNKGIDLDLGCLIEMADGTAGAIQALGNNFGALDEPPYIKLMGDDRTGDSAAGEFLHINGRHWDKLKRVLIYAFIYQGVPNWAAADGVVTLKAPGQPELEVRLDSHSSREGMCAIALLTNDGGSLRVSKEVSYFGGHRLMDQAYGWGLKWARGSKD